MDNLSVIRKQMEEQGIVIPSDLDLVAQLLKMEEGSTLTVAEEDILVITIKGNMPESVFVRYASKVKDALKEATGRKILVIPK